MNKILGLLLAVFLFVPPASAKPPAGKEESAKNADNSIVLCKPGVKPCFKGLAINGNAIDRDLVFFLSIKIQEAYESGADAVILVINSPGGEVTASKLMHTMLTLAPIPVHCVTTTLAASGAFWALEGCYERGMTKDAKLMTHEPAVVIQKPAKAKELLQMIEELKLMAEEMANDVAPRMKLTPQDFLEIIAEEDWWMSADEAVKNNAVDVVSDSLDEYIRHVRSLYLNKKVNKK